MFKFFWSFVFVSILFSGPVGSETIVVGSKNFTESYILAELLASTLREKDYDVSLKLGMGGTGFVLESLKQGAIDIYPEYTGTILQAILHSSETEVSPEEMNRKLKEIGLVAGPSLGFNNTYALIVRKETAERFNLKTISDLKNVTAELTGGFSHEFLERRDGYFMLKKAYQLTDLKSHKAMDHSLAYEALASGSIDVMDAYTTDGKLKKFSFIVLRDDLDFFPRYEPVWLTRLDFVKEHPDLWEDINKWQGRIDEELMTAMNSDVEEKLESKESVLVKYELTSLRESGLLEGRISRIKTYGIEHAYLALVSLCIAVLIGFPLAYGATENFVLKHFVMFLSSGVQTIPSLALLCFMIPFFGVGFLPSVVALVLYALLPIVVNSYTGLSLVNRSLMDMARQLGMNRRQSLWHVQIPIALPYVLAGIKTSSITVIGTATLAALIGAGGFGTPILAGLALNDYSTIMEGAVPVCLMAFMVQLLFQFLEKRLVSPGLY